MSVSLQGTGLTPSRTLFLIAIRAIRTTTKLFPGPARSNSYPSLMGNSCTIVFRFAAHQKTRRQACSLLESTTVGAASTALLQAALLNAKRSKLQVPALLEAKLSGLQAQQCLKQSGLNCKHYPAGSHTFCTKAVRLQVPCCGKHTLVGSKAI